MENKKEKQRFARIIKRPYISDAHSLIIRVIAFVFSFIVVSILLLCMHFNPFNVFAVMLKGAFGKEFLIRETVKGTIPLVITATGLSLAFRMKFWNIGGEGQILIGGHSGYSCVIYFWQVNSAVGFIIAYGSSFNYYGRTVWHDTRSI